MSVGEPEEGRMPRKPVYDPPPLSADDKKLAERLKTRLSEPPVPSEKTKPRESEAEKMARDVLKTLRACQRPFEEAQYLDDCQDCADLLASLVLSAQIAQAEADAKIAENYSAHAIYADTGGIAKAAKTLIAAAIRDALSKLRGSR